MKTQLFALSAALLSGLFACDSAKKPDGAGGPTRGEVVAASAAVKTVEALGSGASPGRDNQTASAAHATAAAGPRRKICDKAPAAKGKTFEGLNVDRIGSALKVACAGDQNVKMCNRKPMERKPDTVTWVNAWAGWCGPCKEEVPHLLSWEKKLQASGKKFQVAFVSIDDDLRQAEKFLAAQPADGMKGSYHLEDGEPRTTFFSRFNMKGDPELPVQMIFDRKGELACVIEGAVDERDYADVERIVSSL